MKQAFGYIRVSGLSQSDGDGPQRQRDKIVKAATAQGMTIVQWFFDDGVKGKTETLNRPAFAEMWSLIGKTSIIICEKLDRLSRDLFVQELCIRDARKASVTLLSADEGDLMASNVDSQDVSRKLYRQMMGAIAEYDKDSIVLKLRAARIRVKASKGRCEGQKPYSDTAEGKAALERMVSLRSAGMGYDKIACHLNAEGVPTKRTGTVWHGFTVNKMMTANNYCPN